MARSRSTNAGVASERLHVVEDLEAGLDAALAETPSPPTPLSLCIPRVALAYDPHEDFRPEPQVAARKNNYGKFCVSFIKRLKRA